MKTLTAKQIRNAYDRAAADARKLAVSSQIEMFAATPEQLADERGAAMCAAGYAAQALANLKAGNYELFLTDLRLAGTFANDATDTFYTRKVGAADAIRAKLVKVAK
jgi:hypothetical protein